MIRVMFNFMLVAVERISRSWTTPLPRFFVLDSEILGSVRHAQPEIQPILKFPLAPITRLTISLSLSPSLVNDLSAVTVALLVHSNPPFAELIDVFTLDPGPWLWFRCPLHSLPLHYTRASPSHTRVAQSEE
jgi:hypothetical protein